MFYVRKPTPSLVDHALSAVGFALLLATWVVGYVTLVPADPIAHRTHVAEVVL